MDAIKEKIKKIVPDRLIYFWKIVKLSPKYFQSIANDSNITIPEVKFYSDVETVDLIITERKSLSRFGDGEFMWMNGIDHHSFQKISTQLGDDLIHAFQNHNPNLLIGIPIGIFDSKGCNLYAKMHWRIIRNSFLEKSLSFLDFDRTYSNASISRPYIDYKSRVFSKNAFTNLKRLWDEKDIVIVEGEATKMGIGNNLFSNAKSIQRIICPSKNAYDKIDEIIALIQKEVSKESMIFGALGPTASILASRLCDLGYQFIDIGHIDVEYTWYLNKAILRDPIEGKHVNESGFDSYDIYACVDDAYINSIIGRIN